MSHASPTSPTGSRLPSASPPSTLRPGKWSAIQPTPSAAAGGPARDSVQWEWVYKDRKGKEVFRILGYEGPGGRRRCRAVHPLREGWVAGEGDGPLPLYRLDQLPPKGIVFVCCDEMSADEAAVAFDLPAVTSAFGAGAAARTDWSPLAGRCVAILPDNHEAGRAYAHEVARLLLALEPKALVKIIQLPDLPRSGELSDFGEDRFHRLRRSNEQVGAEIRELAKQAPLYKLPEEGTVAEGGAAGAVAREPVLTRVSEVEAEEVQWLWPGRVALGKLTLLYGDPGLGKSLLTLDMAARVTTGAAWPDGRGDAPQGSVVLITAEDGQKDTVPARLARAGADAAKIVTLDEIKETGAGGVELRRPFKLADWRELDQAIQREGDVRLVVIDPLSAFLGDSGGSSNAAMRALLAPIVKVAEKRRVAVVMITHVTKGSGGNALHRASGSLAFTAAARAVWLAVADPKDENRRLLLPAKNNLAADEGGLAYRTAGGVVAWEAEPVKKRADAALAARSRRGRGRPAAKRQKAEAWLRGRLAAGPVAGGAEKDPAPGTLSFEAQELGWSWMTIRRALGAVGAVYEICPRTRQFLWQLPHVPQSPADPGGEPRDFDALGDEPAEEQQGVEGAPAGAD